jgi:hypothetical protein
MLNRLASGIWSKQAIKNLATANGAMMSQWLSASWGVERAVVQSLPSCGQDGARRRGPASEAKSLLKNSCPPGVA